MTISEAMHRAVTLPGCQGFCFHGELTEGVIDIWFKSKCTSALCECADTWTSFQLLRDHLVPDPPHAGIEKTQTVLETLAPNVSTPVAVRREEPVASCDMESQMALVVRTLDGCDTTIGVPADGTTLGKLKELIQQETG